MLASDTQHHCSSPSFPPVQHATRMFDSRLGASFSLSIPFVFAALFVFVFGATKAINTKTLVPSSSVNMKGANYHGVDPSTRSPTALFGSIMIEMNTFASSETGARCQDISIPTNLLTEKQAFECDMQTEQTTNVGVLIDGYLFCKTIVSCNVSAAFVASQNVLIQFPDPFQTFNWTVTPDVWSDTPGENVALSHAFNERGAYGAIEDEELSLVIKNSFGLQLAGTKGRPTTVSFSATRSKYKESFDNQRSMGVVGSKTELNYEQWGVQLSYQGVSPIFQTNLGTSLGFHVVSFEFVVEEAIYVNHWESSADPMTAVGTAGAFLLSALAIMRAVKAYMGYGIDLLLLRRRANGDRNASIPSDVAMRHAALVENRKAEIDKAHAILVSETKEMMRLESMAVKSSGDVEMTGENPMQNSTVAKLEQEVKALTRLVHELVADRETGLTL